MGGGGGQELGVRGAVSREGARETEDEGFALGLPS